MSKISKSKTIQNYAGIGLVFGSGIGMTFGVAIFAEVAFGLIFGAGIGLILGAAYGKNSAEKSKHRD